MEGRGPRSVVCSLVLALSVAMGSATGASASIGGSARGVLPRFLKPPSGGQEAACRTLTGRTNVNALRIPGPGEASDVGDWGDRQLRVRISQFDASTGSFAWTSVPAVVGVLVVSAGGLGAWYDYGGFLDAPPPSGADHDAGLLPPEAKDSTVSAVMFCAEAPAPDVLVRTSSDAPSVIHLGDRFTYITTVQNEGAADARGVGLLNVLPRGVRVLDLVPRFDGGSCAVGSSIVSGGSERSAVTCVRSTLPAGASVDLRLRVAVTDQVSCGDLTNRVEVSARNEPRSAVDASNKDTHTDAVACRPSIALIATAPAGAHVGDTARFTFMVENDGETVLRTVRLVATPCAHPSRTSAGNGDTVLAPGERWSYRCPVVVRAKDPDPVVASARVQAVDPIGRTVGRKASARLDVVHPAMQIVPSLSPASRRRASLRISILNVGDVVLRNLRIEVAGTGSVGTIRYLAPGATRVLETTAEIGRGSTALSVDVQVVGIDRLGRQVTAAGSTSVSITRGAYGGTAFTGSDVQRAATLAFLLALLGSAALAFSSRRRRSA
jgi:uncharacterized repeat protein (TIGR01451 family)